MSDETSKPPPPPQPTITVVPSMPVITWQPDFARVVTYNVTPLSADERAELGWLRLPWWRKITTRRPRGPETGEADQ